jgi:hypothetical protein
VFQPKHVFILFVLKKVAKHTPFVLKHDFLFWKQKTVSKTGCQTGSNSPDRICFKCTLPSLSGRTMMLKNCY